MIDETRLGQGHVGPLRSANPARRDVLFLIYEGRRQARGRLPIPIQNNSGLAQGLAGRSDAG